MAYLEVRTQKIGCVNHDCDECKAKAQRTWVGLTDEDILAIGRELGLKCRLGGNPNIDFDYARVIEAKLKEKNT